jgi:hypothetical protein
MTASAAEVVASTMKESEFTTMVLDLARYHGWRTLHLRPARTDSGWRTAVQGDGVGWPDLYMVRGGRVVAAELKVGRRQLTPEQTAWLTALGQTGAEVHVWWPKDWDLIEKVLS